jgi:hypothetical protein
LRGDLARRALLVIFLGLVAWFLFFLARIVAGGGP